MLWKPLIRWTVGPCRQAGFEILKKSVSSIKNIYKDRFDYVICHNNLSEEKLDMLKSLDVGLFDVKMYNFLKLFKKGWRLVPPRLRLSAHEIILDNDLIIDREMPELELFLEGEYILVAGSMPLSCRYGRFRRLIKGRKFKINTGFLGLPPNFDLAAEIKTALYLMPRVNLSDGSNERGLIAWIISDYPHRIIPLSSLSMAEADSSLIVGRSGVHFVGANVRNHAGWDEYSRTEFMPGSR